MNQKIVTATYILASIGLTVLAVKLWNYSDDELANAAIDVSYEVETPDNWSGRAKPDFNLSAPALNISFPPPDDGGDGDGN